MPRVVAEPGLELLPVGLEILGDLRVGHRDPGRHLAPDEARHLDPVTHPFLDGLQSEALSLDEPLELLAALDVDLLDPLGQLFLDLGLVHDDLVALGLLELEPALDHPPEELLDELVRRLRGLLVLVPVDRDGLLQLGERDRVVVHHRDDAVRHARVE